MRESIALLVERCLTAATGALFQFLQYVMADEKITSPPPRTAVARADDGSGNFLPLAAATAALRLLRKVIPKSLRFNDSDSAYLSKTFLSAGNRRTWTFLVW